MVVIFLVLLASVATALADTSYWNCQFLRQPAPYPLMELEIDTDGPVRDALVAANVVWSHMQAANGRAVVILDHDTPVDSLRPASCLALPNEQSARALSRMRHSPTYEPLTDTVVYGAGPEHRRTIPDERFDRIQDRVRRRQR